MVVYKSRQVEVNSLPVSDRTSTISFEGEGQKSGHHACTNSTGKVKGLEIAS